MIYRYLTSKISHYQLVKIFFCVPNNNVFRYNNLIRYESCSLAQYLKNRSVSKMSPYKNIVCGSFYYPNDLYVSGYQSPPNPFLVKFPQLSSFQKVYESTFKNFQNEKINNAMREKINSQQLKLKEFQLRTLEKSNKAKKNALSLWKKYGYLGIGVYLIVYVITLGSFFTAINCDIITAKHIKKWLNIFHLSDRISENLLNNVDTPGGKFILAWVAAKIFEPLRLFVSLSLTPLILKVYKNYKIYR